MTPRLLSVQSPAQPLSRRVRRLRLVGEMLAAAVGLMLGAALTVAAAPAKAAPPRLARSATG